MMRAKCWIGIDVTIDFSVATTDNLQLVLLIIEAFEVPLFQEAD